MREQPRGLRRLPRPCATAALRRYALYAAHALLLQLPLAAASISHGSRLYAERCAQRAEAWLRPLSAAARPASLRLPAAYGACRLRQAARDPAYGQAAYAGAAGCLRYVASHARYFFT